MSRLFALQYQKSKDASFYIIIYGLPTANFRAPIPSKTSTSMKNTAASCIPTSVNGSLAKSQIAYQFCQGFSRKRLSRNQYQLFWGLRAKELIMRRMSEGMSAVE
jgi:hypothetical protein